MSEMLAKPTVVRSRKMEQPNIKSSIKTLLLIPYTQEKNLES
jgi:hypothetical protein